MMGKALSKTTWMAAGTGLLLLFNAAYAANYLQNISVSRAGDSIVATITTSAECQYKAFLTEGKPERIVVDLEGVINNWKEKRFYDLPFKSIESVRTSQFQVSPYLVSRVVFDIGRPVDFRSSRSGNATVVTFQVAPGEEGSGEWQARGRKVAAKGSSPPKSAPALPLKRSKTVASAKPAGIELESYPKRKLVRYRASASRDPFVPLIGTGGQLIEGLPNLESLKLVGILEDIDGNKALLEDAEGNGYMLGANDKIRNGYVVSVAEDKVIFQVTEYGWTRTVALELEVPEIK